MNKTNIGHAIKYWSKKRGLSQKKLSELTGITASTLSGFNSGLREPNESHKREISKALSIPFKYIELYVSEDLYLSDVDLEVMRTGEKYFKDLIEEKYLS